MDITSAQYINNPISGTVNSSIKAEINGKTWYIPINPNNRHYAEIMRQVEAGELVIEDAE